VPDCFDPHASSTFSGSAGEEGEDELDAAQRTAEGPIQSPLEQGLHLGIDGV